MKKKYQFLVLLALGVLGCFLLGVSVALWKDEQNSMQSRPVTSANDSSLKTVTGPNLQQEAQDKFGKIEANGQFEEQVSGVSQIPFDVVKKELWETPHPPLSLPVTGADAAIEWSRKCQRLELDANDYMSTLRSSLEEVDLISITATPQPEQWQSVFRLTHRFVRANERSTVTVYRDTRQDKFPFYLRKRLWSQPFPKNFRETRLLVESSDTLGVELTRLLERELDTMYLEGFERRGWNAVTSDKVETAGTSQESTATILRIRNSKVTRFDFGAFRCQASNGETIDCACQDGMSGGV